MLTGSSDWPERYVCMLARVISWDISLLGAVSRPVEINL